MAKPPVLYSAGITTSARTKGAAINTEAVVKEMTHFETIFIIQIASATSDGVKTKRIIFGLSELSAAPSRRAELPSAEQNRERLPHGGLCPCRKLHQHEIPEPNQ